MLYGTILKGDGPAGIVIPNRSRDEKRTRELGVHDDLCARGQLLRKGMLVLRVGEDVVINVAFCLVGFAEVLSCLFHREDFR